MAKSHSRHKWEAYCLSRCYLALAVILEGGKGEDGSAGNVRNRHHLGRRLPLRN